MIPRHVTANEAPPGSDGDVILGSTRLTEKDLRDGITAMSPMIGARWLLLGFCMLLFVIPVAAGGGRKMVVEWAPMVAYGAILLGFVFTWAGRSARKMLRSLRALDGDIHFRFDRDGMTMVAPGCTVTLAYRIIPRFRETPEAFLIYGSTRTANIVPKRSFAAADVPRISALLTTNIQDTLGKRRGPWRWFFSFIVWLVLFLSLMAIWGLVSGQHR
jgi:hypothetical protein